jgi:hypothetical protein
MAKKEVIVEQDAFDLFGDDGGSFNDIDMDNLQDMDDEPKEEEDDEPEDEPKEKPKSIKKTIGNIEYADDDDDDEPINDEDKSALRIFAEMQREKGLLDFKDEEYEDSEEFILNKAQDTIANGIANGIEEYKKSLPAEVKDIIDNYEEGVGLDAIIQNKKSLEYYEKITDEKLESDDKLQENLVREYYKEKGFSDEKIDKKIARLKVNEDLEDEAKEALEEITEIKKAELEKVKEQQRIAKENEAKAYNTWVESFKKDIDGRSEILKGIPVSAQDKKELQDAILKFDKQGKNEMMRMREADPDFDLKVLYAAKILKWDLGKIKASAKSEATKSLLDAVNNGSGSRNRNISPSSSVSKKVIENALKQGGGDF